jgi:hypothetical protein
MVLLMTDNSLMFCFWTFGNLFFFPTRFFSKQLRIRGQLNEQVRVIELERTATLEFANIKQQLENAFGFRGTNIKYRRSDGQVIAVYADNHIDEAFKDSQKSGKRAVAFEIDGGSAVAGGAQASSSSATRPSSQQLSTPTRSTSTATPTKATAAQSSTPTKQQQQQQQQSMASSPVAESPISSGGGRTCPECNAPLSAKAKFCAGCGAKTPIGAKVDNRKSAPPASTSPAIVDDDHCAACGAELSGTVAKGMNERINRLP